MPVMPPTHRPRGGRSRREARRELDRDRGTAAERGYDARWQRAAKAHLAAWPLCRYCECGAWGDPPRVAAATLVDHFHPHRGDMALFWASGWWVSSCKPCHDGPKQSVERQGAGALDRLAQRIGLPPR